ncbi:hypothetical protein CK203_061693 [Vitis vinifera]|uniref:Uncharacterized protein n=1 Tax=Vitis vinifera TaxID=29760 RepID=A0A438G890_VITVI|nr:hypothetical protein CK203_061693 [Vitis vinifera]
MCFLEEIPDYDLPMDLGDGSDGSVRLCGPPLSFDTMSAPTTHVCDVDDVGDTDDPLSGQSECDSDSDTEDRKVTPISGHAGLDPTIVQHHLPILPHARPVKQKLRRLHPRWSLQVKEEIQKQLSVGFLSVVEYPEWLANVVHVPKKDDKVRVCVDFEI